MTANTLRYDGTAMLGRQLLRVRNNPALVILTQTMPITMLLFFGYVFGSALAMPGAQYRSVLVPGLLVATAANGIMTGMFQAAQDVHRGVTDRLRTLPVSRAAVPLGQRGGAIAFPRVVRGHAAARRAAAFGEAVEAVVGGGGGQRPVPAALGDHLQGVDQGLRPRGHQVQDGGDAVQGGGVVRPVGVPADPVRPAAPSAGADPRRRG